jgi:hypothetical protein
MRRFMSLDLTKASATAVRKAFRADLLLKRVNLTIRWTEDRNLVLVRLQLQIGPDEWRNLIEHPLRDSDGSGTISLGDHAPGTTITARFACRAVEAIPHAAAFVWQRDPDEYAKVSPTDANTKALGVNAPWSETFEYTVL